MMYLTQELTSYIKEKHSDSETGEWYEEIVEKKIIDFELFGPDDLYNVNIVWRTSIWNLAINRSFEIWKKLSPIKLENSLGALTIYGKRSLKGKLGAGNKHYFIKNSNEIWTFIKFKENKRENIFKPFTERAIEICKLRARQYKH